MAAYKQNPKTKRWYFVIDVGYDIHNKRKQKTISKDDKGKTFENEQQARRYAVKIEQEITRGKKFESVGFEDFITEFFKRVVKEQVSEVTYLNQWQIAKNYIIPYLGKMKIEKITDNHIEGLYQKLLGDGVARGIIRNSSIVLSKTFRHAKEKKKIIMDNPMDVVTKPSYKPAKTSVWSREQVIAFLDGCVNSKFYAIYVTAAETGMRRGELLALEWKNINFDKGTIVINHALKYTPELKLFVSGTKTQNSRRTIRISKKVIDVLTEHKENQMNGVNIVFDNFGEYYRLGELSRYFQVDRELLGLPYMKFHGLRHAHATYLLSKGFDAKRVAERLGDTVTTVLETYAHVIDSMQDDVVNALNEDWD
jgi:integrase